MILREQEGRCANPNCLKEHQLDPRECETNHIIPWHKGGRTTRWNLEVLCITCHKNHTRSDAKQRMKKKVAGIKQNTGNPYAKTYRINGMRLSKHEKTFIFENI
jgi:5-methylcytosine-specific restriction endonuclease McrA